MWQPILEETTKAVLLQTIQFAGIIFLVIILLLAGLIVSRLVKTLVMGALRKLRFDEFSSCIALAKVLKKGGITYPFSELIGIVFYWISFLLSLVVILNATGLTIAAELFNKIIFYIPNVIVSVFILLLGIFFAGVLNNFVKTVTLNAGMKQGGRLGKIVEVIMIIFVIVMALEQLKIKVKIVEVAVGIMLGSVGLAFAIAVGLGCKDFIGRKTWSVLKRYFSSENQTD